MQILLRSVIQPLLEGGGDQPDVRLEGAVRAGDGGAAGQAGHAVARHGERILGVGRHAGERGGDARVAGQTAVARLLVARRVAGARVGVAQRRAVARVQRQGWEDRTCRQKSLLKRCEN